MFFASQKIAFIALAASLGLGTVSVVVAAAEEGGEDFCRQLGECLDAVAEETASCRARLNSTPGPDLTSRANRSNCRLSRDERLRAEEGKAFRSCLREGKNFVLPASSISKKRRCELAGQRYRSRLGSTKTGAPRGGEVSPGGRNDSGDGTDARGLTPNDVKAGTQDGTDGNGTRTGDPRRPPSVGADLGQKEEGGAAKVPPATRRRHRGRGRGHRGRGHGGRHGNGRRGEGETELKRCMRGVAKTKSLCRPLAGCCSEMEICRLKFKLTPAHDEMIRQRLAAIEEKRKCLTAQDTPRLSDEPGAWSDAEEHDADQDLDPDADADDGAAGARQDASGPRQEATSEADEN